MDNRILRLPQVIELTGFSRSSIYALMKTGEFPLSIKLGQRAVGWKEQDINNWINSRASYTQH
ncbi:AlpA family transcriptional regulator [Vibrio cholerae]|uniref:helix-turn-helix transcriptional regulator n=1 Tax=Vibrio cholerae TaxID=666 RepID=UPI000F3FC413|nr:AlpA family transcriptional regulator [Vibrio cholerae]RNE79107.1 AlpA family transcriptional regulator [Vibrio cholerae]